MTKAKGVHFYSLYGKDNLVKCINFCAANKFNHIRFAIISVPIEGNDGGEYASFREPWWVEPVLTMPEWERRLNLHCDKIISVRDLCQAKGVKIAIDFHAYLGCDFQPSTNYQQRLFFNADYQTKFVRMWALVAKRLKNEPHIYAYDLINEPHPPSGFDYKRFNLRVGKEIRKYDKKTPIIIEGYKDFMGNLLRINPNDYKAVNPCIYSGHWYWKTTFTGAGAGTYPSPGFTKADIYKHIGKAKAWAEKYGVKIYCGEVGTTSNASTWKRWYRDSMEALSKAGFDIVFHQYQDFAGDVPAAEAAYKLEILKKS